MAPIARGASIPELPPALGASPPSGRVTNLHARGSTEGRAGHALLPRAKPREAFFWIAPDLCLVLTRQTP